MLMNKCNALYFVLYLQDFSCSVPCYELWITNKQVIFYFDSVDQIPSFCMFVIILYYYSWYIHDSHGCRGAWFPFTYHCSITIYFRVI